jgi:hypothetical protein
MDSTIDSALIRLPEELQDWADAHKPMISRLSAAIAKKPTMPEGAVWEMIAAEFSPEWMHAKSNLKSAEQQVKYLALPENMPLGLIGGALQSEETNHAHQTLAHAMADFTILDETLRQQEKLRNLLGAARKHQKTIRDSLDISRQMERMTAAFAAATGFDAEELCIEPKRNPFSLKGGQLTLSFAGVKSLRSRTSAALKGGSFRNQPNVA